MSLPAIIELPSPTGGGTHYSKSLLSAYLRLISPTQIREDVENHGFYLAKGEDVEHEAIALEELKPKLELIINGAEEKRKNSWVNTLSRNLSSKNDKAVASMIVSLWRRLLSETSLKKSERSAYGYALNGNCRSKSMQEKDIKALCEWCSKEITMPTDKGFMCSHCGVYFADFKPQKMKIKKDFENFYFQEYNDEKNVLEKIKTGEFELKKAKKNNAAQLAFAFELGA